MEGEGWMAYEKTRRNFLKSMRINSSRTTTNHMAPRGNQSKWMNTPEEYELVVVGGVGECIPCWWKV